MGKRKRRTRRAFSDEFKAETVKLVRGSDKSIAAIARELDLTETALRAWVRQAEIDAGRGRAGALTTDGGAASRGAPDAAAGPARAEEAAVPDDDRLAARAAGCGQRARPAVHGHRPGHGLGDRHHVPVDPRGLALPRGDP